MTSPARTLASLASLASLVLLAAVAACGGSNGTAATGAPQGTYTGTTPVVVPGTLGIASWNLEWFGDPSFGPVDDPLQLSNVRQVVAASDLDIWAVQEVCDTTQFEMLRAGLPGYDGFLANDPFVVGGAASYGYSEQKVGLLYKRGAASVIDARIILADHDYDFAGRPPLQVTLEVNVDGTTRPLVLIVLHAKAYGDVTSYLRRQAASVALKAYLDAGFGADQEVLVVGDFNDDLDVSTVAGLSSPYENFGTDAPRYQFPTRVLSDSGTPTLAQGGLTLDHQLAVNLPEGSWMSASVQVLHPEGYIPGYAATTSDHLPVVNHYRIAGW